ncbi:unnamed protein product [Effrenium voratum]|uniref:EF-hand domain-containing protein n=1 Tax=Effrenium voratum TaxID=2562239 RepID=A0AA36I9N9_9DINO|nr:unnamed protein product [Effrenium voratum]CAJ1429146.1 unnamed protein product [Effrenium voratum]
MEPDTEAPVEPQRCEAVRLMGGNACVHKDMDDMAAWDLKQLLAQQHQEILHKLESQNERLQALIERVAPVQPLSVVEAAILGAGGNKAQTSYSMKSAKNHRREPLSPSLTKGGAKPKSFISYDDAMREVAHTADADRSRRRFASNKEKRSFNPAPPNRLQRLVRHPMFDLGFGLVVVANAVFIGVEVQSSINSFGPSPLSLQVLQILFTAIFILELILRMAVDGRKYFFSEDWAWGWLDLFIVLSSIWEVVFEYVYIQEDSGDNIAGVTSLKAIRIIRITRLIKTIRVMRILRFVMALRTLVTSIFHTLRSLFWSLMLLGVIIYIFAVLFTQAVNDYRFDPDVPELPEREKLQSERYFNSLSETMLSLFMSIAGGVSWEEVIGPLKLISPVWTLLYVFFTAFTYFAVLNVVTAVFCSSAIESAQNDHLALVHTVMANKEAHLEKIRALFKEMGADDEKGITFAQLEENINSPPIQVYFESLGLDVSDAWSFFKLLDLDAGGSVEIEEFLMGCLHLRGTARAIDVGKIIHDQAWLIKNQERRCGFRDVVVCPCLLSP